MNNATITYNIGIRRPIYKKLVIGLLDKIVYGSIIIEDLDETIVFGANNPGQQVIIKITSHNFYKLVFWNGGMGLAEAYILGLWQTDTVTTLLRILTRNLNTVDRADHSLRGVILRTLSKFVHVLNKNDFKGARKNISKHYDLGNDFFKLFLDPTMMYSSAIFSNPHDTLEQASINKLHTICNKLELKASDHLLEIGTGWGGLACYAALNYGCRVTTTTISQEQFIYAKQQITQLGLESQVTLLLQDYRHLTGHYDKLVSIEMIEAVGHHYYSSYFKKCSDLVKNDGMFVLQAITIAEQRYKSARDSVDFIKQYIFPGCCIPSLTEIMKNVRDYTTYSLLASEDITLDYARTLNHWQANFNSKLAEIRAHGFDEQFIRKWNYYFSYCEAGFLERAIFDLQLVFVKPEYRTPEYENY